MSHCILGELTCSELLHPVLELREGHTCSVPMNYKMTGGVEGTTGYLRW